MFFYFLEKKSVNIKKMKKNYFNFFMKIDFFSSTFKNTKSGNLIMKSQS